MKLGVRAHDYGRHTIAEYARILAEEGYETVQLAVPKAFCEIQSYEDITPKLLEEIRTEFEKRRIEIAVMGCYMDLGNPNEEVRRQAVDTFKRCMGYGKILGARLTGTETAYPHLSRSEKVQWYPCMMDSLKRLTEEAERLDVWIGIEPVAWHPLEDAETACEVLKELGSDHVKIIFDPANVMERPGEVRQKAYWKRCFDLLGPYIEAIHLKDFVVDEQGRYCGKPLGEGVMEYDVLKEWLKNHPSMAVLREEMDPMLAKQDIQFMRKIGE